MPGLNKRTTLPSSGAYGGFGPCGRGLGPGGRRRWFQRGFSGMGMRMRMRCHGFFQRFFGNEIPVDAPPEKDYLLSRKRSLEQELREINERLSTTG